MIDKITGLAKRKDGSVSRTQIVNSITVLSGVLLTTLPGIQEQLSASTYGMIIMVLGTVNAYLRKTTTQP